MYTNIPIGHKKQFQSTEKEKIFENLITKIRPFLRKLKSVDYGALLLRFDFNGQTFEIKLIEKPKNYRCKLCGRDKFTKKSHHNCKGRYRTGGFEWEELK